MRFEWDTNKNRKNLRKHGVSFEEILPVFRDPNLLIIPDPCEEEERWDAIGLVGTVMFVVYTERSEDVIRIISARKATKEERNGYQKHIHGRS